MSYIRFIFGFLICSLLLTTPGYSSLNKPDEPVIKMPMTGPIQTPAIQHLDGEWEFLPIAATITEVTTGKYKNQWGTINVPALWWEADLPSSSTVNWTGPSTNTTNQNKDPLYITTPHAWYRLRFDLASELTTFNGRILFGCVKWSCDAWMNGKYLGHHLGGYAPFDFEISKYMKPGKENVLLLKVGGWGSVPFTKDGKPQITTGTIAPWSNRSGGITESIALRFYKRIAIQNVFALPDIDTGTVNVRVTIKNPKNLKPDDQLDIYLTDKRSMVPINQMTIPIDNDTVRGIAGGELIMDIPEPKLWSPWNPFLYQVSCLVKDKNNLPMDIQVETFGLRKFETRDGNFYLNNQRIQLRGANLFQEVAYSMGSNVTLDPKFAKRYLVDIAREANIMAFRTHLGPMNKDWLDLCDANGVLIISEFPVSQMSNNWEDTTFGNFAIQEYKDLIPYLWNHPSIIIWSISNESWSDEKRAVENNFIYPMIKSMDPTRLILRAGDVSKDLMDLHAYEGVWYKTMDDFRKRVEGIHKFENKIPVLCTEYLETGSNENGIWYDKNRARMHLGNNLTPQAMALKHAELAAVQTETLRIHQYDGIFPYFYSDWVNLSSWAKHTADKSYPKKKTTYFAIKNALAPVAISVDLRESVFSPESEMTVPVHAINDLPINVPVKVELLVLKDNPLYLVDRVREFSQNTQFYAVSSASLDPFSIVSDEGKIPISKEAFGTYFVVGVITRLDTQEAFLSQREILITK